MDALAPADLRRHRLSEMRRSVFRPVLPVSATRGQRQHVRSRPLPRISAADVAEVLRSARSYRVYSASAVPGAGRGILDFAAGDTPCRSIPDDCGSFRDSSPVRRLPHGVSTPARSTVSSGAILPKSEQDQSRFWISAAYRAAPTPEMDDGNPLHEAYLGNQDPNRRPSAVGIARIASLPAYGPEMHECTRSRAARRGRLFSRRFISRRFVLRYRPRRYARCVRNAAGSQSYRPIRSQRPPEDHDVCISGDVAEHASQHASARHGAQREAA